MAYDDMTVKNGKFYKLGKEVPIEHGNREQIDLINRVQEMQKEGFMPELYHENKVTVVYSCICGTVNSFEASFGDGDTTESILDGEVDTCTECKVKYKVFICPDEGVMMKMLPKK